MAFARRRRRSPRLDPAKLAIICINYLMAILIHSFSNRGTNSAIFGTGGRPVSVFFLLLLLLLLLLLSLELETSEKCLINRFSVDLSSEDGRRSCFVSVFFAFRPPFLCPGARFKIETKRAENKKKGSTEKEAKFVVLPVVGSSSSVLFEQCLN